MKEFVQLGRDRLTFGTMIFIPFLQLTLFGFAINTTPRHLPTAVLEQYILLLLAPNFSCVLLQET